MKLGYNTNGFAHHRLEDAVAILAETGYRAVGVTLDCHHLNPFRDAWRTEAEGIRALLGKRDLACVVESGARYILDPRRKHQPTLISNNETEREQRLDYLHRCVDVAAALGAEAISVWSGEAPAGVEEGELFERLVNGLRRVLHRAEAHEVRVAFEPEPGALIRLMEQFERLSDAIDHPLFGLTLDVGHVHCLGDGSIAEHLRCWRERLFNVHLDDMRAGAHNHLFFGEGEIDFCAVIDTLKEINYPGVVQAELSRHSHEAVTTARRAYRFLAALIE